MGDSIKQGGRRSLSDLPDYENEISRLNEMIEDRQDTIGKLEQEYTGISQTVQALENVLEGLEENSAREAKAYDEKMNRKLHQLAELRHSESKYQRRRNSC